MLELVTRQGSMGGVLRMSLVRSGACPQPMPHQHLLEELLLLIPTPVAVHALMSALHSVASG